MLPVEARFRRWVVLLASAIPEIPEALIRAHCAHLEALDAEGVLELAGPFVDGSGGMLVLKAEDEAAAKALAERDPFVAQGARSYTLRPLAISCRDNAHLGMGGPYERRDLQGLGGAFFYCRDPAGVAAWYREHFGLETEAWGTSHGAELPSRDSDPGAPIATTTLAFFEATDEHPPGSGRLNLRLAALDPVLERLDARGISVEKRFGGYGRFAWIRDPEGRLVELWEPPAASEL